MDTENFDLISLQEVEENEEKLRRYVTLLAAANELARLTGPSDEETLWSAHVLDCAAALPLLPKEGRVIDVGTGGGLPGIVWAICRPELRVTLLDSISKKCALLEKISIAAELKNITVVCQRAEDYAKAEREKFHIAAARAVSATGILAELLAPFVRIKGKAIAFKGPKVTDEIEEIGNKWGALGFAPPYLRPYRLGEMKRYLLVWNKISQTPKGIPRRVGLAEKFPWHKK